MLVALAFVVGLLIGAVIVERLSAAEINRLRGLIGPFDHDGDGKPGGSKPQK